MSYIVPIADVGEPNVFHIAKALLQSEIVSERLAGMLQVAERIDHRNGSMFGHAFNRLLLEGSQHDHIHPALEILRNVTELFARVDAAGSLVHKMTDAAEAGHSRLKRKPSPQRRLLEKHHHLLAGQSPLIDRRARLHELREVKHRLDSLRAKIANRN